MGLKHAGGAAEMGASVWGPATSHGALMMEVIHLDLSNVSWGWARSIPPDEVSDSVLMYIQMEYVFPPFSRCRECETNWAKLRGYLLINQAEKRGEHIEATRPQAGGNVTVS